MSVSEATASLLLSPLSLYSWLASTLWRLVLSLPTLVLASLYHSLLLLLAVPWCVATIGASLLLTGLQVALYLLHLSLVVGAVVLFIVTQQKSVTTERQNWMGG